MLFFISSTYLLANLLAIIFILGIHGLFMWNSFCTVFRQSGRHIDIAFFDIFQTQNLIYSDQIASAIEALR